MVVRRARRRERGMTILEIMVVLAIIALVVGLGAPRVMDSFQRAKGQTARVALADLQSAVQLYYIDTGRYPTEAEGLDALLTPPPGVTGWQGPYLENEEKLLDPWQRRVIYRAPGQTGPFELISLGRDGQPGGSREDSDISL
jgi:general secretion pathway protein G